MCHELTGQGGGREGHIDIKFQRLSTVEGGRGRCGAVSLATIMETSTYYVDTKCAFL